MSLDINARSWQFLDRRKAKQYIECHDRHRVLNPGWKQLKLPTTKRQFTTAKAILDRMNSGTEGILLADDAGLGKTTVATLCALVFAGNGKSVRILAPNDVMARRWRQELELHIDAVAECARSLKLDTAKSRLRSHIAWLTDGTIAVSTHQKAERLLCDLLIVDEAHRARSEHSRLGRAIGVARNQIGRLLVITATPFSIDPNDLATLLQRIGGDEAVKPMRDYAELLTKLWRGRYASTPREMAAELGGAARLAVKEMKPFVIRHGIRDLATSERKTFGEIPDVDDAGATTPLEASEELLEVMLRADRALELGKRCKAWPHVRRNDPRYHVSTSKLAEDLEVLTRNVAGRGGDAEALAAHHHGRRAQTALRTIETHPKIADTVRMAKSLVAQGEKVLIFCRHHLPAAELTAALADAIRWPERAVGHDDVRAVWRAAWDEVFEQESETVKGRSAETRLDNFIEWLCSEGVRAQVGHWLGETAASALVSKRSLIAGLARDTNAGYRIAAQAKQLYQQLIDRESASTRSILLRSDPQRLPGATHARVAAVCDPDASVFGKSHPEVFFTNAPDTVVAVFNSPFGPDVLVSTDTLSEGVDLHRFCRHLIHHELDPSPVRTVQRNGRLRRVDSWASKVEKPIRVLYPALMGTRDEKAVAIMRQRISQFDLLMGAVREEVDVEEVNHDLTGLGEILKHAGEKMRGLNLLP
ncbi:helicase [Caballeronia sordidicola]|uniref:Helicase n=1 Tax=Caballeronia sordidicola TaxID=196367 RepID=A0A158HGN5_CABSO|nr:SNF2-related protein [Caballeronia sordidicola]SAL43131.1 helicase [Caballeronia sordidicola]